MVTSDAVTAAELVQRDRIMIGGSEGSLRPLLAILSDLPANLPAAVFIVQHRLADARAVEPVIAASCKLPVVRAEDRLSIRSGVIYVPPPDFHLLFADGQMRVVRGPRENLARPSIDVLFRSAAVEFGARVIALVLSGAMDDGANGLSAVHRCGGHAIVQAPSESANDELPKAALQAVPHREQPVAEIAGTLVRLCSEPAWRKGVPSDIALEARAAAHAMEGAVELVAPPPGEPTHLTCPECDGPIFHTESAGGNQYRCDVGHAFSLQTMSSAQSITLERALWVAFRTLLERARLLEHLAANSESRGMRASGLSYRKRMEELKEHSKAVLAALGTLDGLSSAALGKRKGLLDA